MSASIMLSTIREHGSRRQYRDACQHAARGNTEGIRTLYRRIVGHF